MTDRIRGLLGVSAAAPIGPVAVLFGLNFVDEFDRIAFTTLLPEIRDTFGLTDAQVGSIGIVTGLFLLLAAVPVGVLADRVNRIGLCTGAAVLWMTMSALTGVVPSLVLLVLVRFIAGIGRGVNEIVHPALLTDLYEPRDQPAVFAFHRLANPLSSVTAIVAGGLAVAFGWQWAFVVLAVPTFPLIFAVRRIPEPPRRRRIAAPIDDGDEADVPAGAALSVRAAFRVLVRLRTLRRLWLAGFIVGAAILPVALVATFYLEDVHGLGPLGRGVAQVIMGAAGAVGLVLSGRAAKRIPEADAGGALARHAGRWLTLAGVGIALTAVAPTMPLAIAGLAVVGIGSGGQQPVFLPLVGRVVPPEVRAMAYGSFALVLGFGAIGALPLLAIGESAGYRVALVAGGALGALAGLVVASAQSQVALDVSADVSAELTPPTGNPT